MPNEGPWQALAFLKPSTSSMMTTKGCPPRGAHSRSCCKCLWKWGSFRRSVKRSGAANAPAIEGMIPDVHRYPRCLLVQGLIAQGRAEREAISPKAPLGAQIQRSPYLLFKTNAFPKPRSSIPIPMKRPTTSGRGSTKRGTRGHSKVTSNRMRRHLRQTFYRM